MEDISFDRISQATGLLITRASFEFTLRLQNEEQQRQYAQALEVATLIYEDAHEHGGSTTAAASDEWARLNELIAFWASMAELATPKRRGWFGRKEIHFMSRTTLLRALSPDAEIIRSGELR